MKQQSFADELNNDTDNLHAGIYEIDLPPLPTREPEIREVVPDGAIIPAEHGWLYRQFKLTPIGVQIAEDTTEEEWRDLGDALVGINSAIQWLLGDWLRFGERKWKKTYEEIALEKGYEIKSLYQYVWVAKSVDVSMRIETLTFTHHSLVASKSPDEQRYWLEKAALGKWTISQMRKEMRPKPPTLSAKEETMREIRGQWTDMMEEISQIQNDPKLRREALEMLEGMQVLIDGWRKALKG